MRRYFESVLRQLNVRVEARGIDKVARHAPCVLAANHNSLLDVPCVGAVLEVDYRWVSKKEIFSVPFVGWHLRACGHLWVDRRRGDNTRRLAGEFRRVLGEGASILVFPEGTRSEDGALQPFRRGAFVTAVAEQVPVLPIAIDGTEHLMQKGSFRLPGAEAEQVVGVRVMDPVFPPLGGDVEASVLAVRDACHTALARGLDGLRGRSGAASVATVRRP